MSLEKKKKLPERDGLDFRKAVFTFNMKYYQV